MPSVARTGKAEYSFDASGSSNDLDLNTLERSSAFSSAVSAQEPSVRCNVGMFSFVTAFAKRDLDNLQCLLCLGYVLASSFQKSLRTCVAKPEEVSGPFSSVLRFKCQLAFAV